MNSLFTDKFLRYFDTIRYQTMRASLLINCSKREAQEVRSRALLQRRTVSGYVVNIVARRIQFAQEIAPRGSLRIVKIAGEKPAKATGPRTTLHIYCSFEEARQIRRAARLEAVTISGFVFRCLWHSWQIEDSLAEIQRKRGIRRPKPWTEPGLT